MTAEIAHSGDADGEIARALAPIGQRAGKLGVEIAGIAGLIEDLSAVGLAQTERVTELMAAAREMRETTHSLGASMGETVAAAEETRRVFGDSATKINAVMSGSITTMTQLSDGALAARDTVTAVDESAGAVQQASASIGQIARETKLLALNASVEAARAGDAGAGFAIIASAVKGLADQIGVFSGQIETQLEAMEAAIKTLASQTQANAETAKQAIEDSEAARAASVKLSELSGSVDRLVTDIDAMRTPVARNTEGFATIDAGLKALSGSTDESKAHLDIAREQAQAILSISEDFILYIAQSGVETTDTPLITHAKRTADAISRLFEEAVATGKISMRALFDERYQPIAGSNPEQVLTGFTEFTDAYLPALQEPVLKADPRVAFCAAVDRNGYLPTHNKIYSRPQGDDPVWNTANCRNRRIFNDRTGLASARSTRPFLLQTYRRDMGGGKFVLMKECSAPITVQGRHWGGLRLAFKAE